VPIFARYTRTRAQGWQVKSLYQLGMVIYSHTHARARNGNKKATGSPTTNATKKAGVIRGFFYPLLTPWRMEENTEKQKLYTLYSGIK
jgi:hypothetical protein